MKPKQPAILGCFSYATTIIGLVLVIPIIIVLVYRHTAESRLNTVEIAADYYQLLEVADSYNYPIEQFLKDIQDAGIPALALVEDTPHNLENRGLCYVIHGADWIGFETLEERKKIKAFGGVMPDEWDQQGIDLRLKFNLDPIQTHLVFTDDDLGQRVGDSARIRYTDRVSVHEIDDMTVISIAGDARLVYEIGLGFNTDLPARLSNMGFRVIPRLRNDRFISGDVINTILNTIFASADFEKGIIFDGDEVLGYPSGLTSVIQTLRDNDAYFGWVEFAKQAGEKSIASALPGQTVRVHSIEDKEMEVYTISKAVARFARAVRERGCRLVYIKPFLFPQGMNNIGNSITYFGRVKSSIEQEGMRIGPPSLYNGVDGRWTDPARPWAQILISFYVFMVATYLVANEMRHWPKWVGILPLVAIVIVAIVIIAMPGSSFEDLLLKLIALLAALAFPILGISELVNTLASTQNRRTLARALLFWIGTIFFAFLGGLIVAALLAERKYMLQIDSFSGVKISLMLPVLAAIVLGVRLVVPRERVSQGLVDNIRFLLNYQVQVKHIVAFLILAGAGLFLLMRSGNEPLFGVGEFESGVRAKLELLFYARPRTKEFLIGYPLLLAGILWHMRGRTTLGYLGIVGGSIGLASVVNTFCHIHIPIALSLLRTFWGILLGLVIGLIIYYVVELLIRIFRISPARQEPVDIQNPSGEE